MERKVYVICGPTAVGKTAVAMELAARLGTAIVSADSRQCYKEMTIGTAKPSPQALATIKHYFIDAFSVINNLTAADYESLALDYLEEIFSTNDSAVVCGGTGLYIRALCEGMDKMPPVNDAANAEVNRQYEAHGISWLQQSIREEDPGFFETGEIQNPARMLRALVFIRSTGESIINFRKGERKPRNFKIIKIGLELPREVLYANINTRVDAMMKNGLMDEVKALYPLRKLKNLQTVGYVELFEYIDEQRSLEEAIEEIKKNTRHYAKRQMTWFKKDKEITWFPANDKDIQDKILAIV